MKYVKSVINSAPSTICCSIKCVTIVEWIFIILYIAIIIWISKSLEINLNFNNFDIINMIWIGWIAISTFLTFYGILSLIKVIKELKTKNPLLKFNTY